MIIVKNIAVVGVALGAVAAAGFLAPDHVVIKRTGLTKATPEAVSKLASSSAGYQTFNPYKVSDPALKIATFGPASGVGAGFTFDGKDGKGSQTVLAQTSDRIDYRIKVEGMGEPRQAIQTKATADGTQIEWSIRVDLGNNPVMRLIGFAMPAMMGPTLEASIENLAAAATRA